MLVCFLLLAACAPTRTFTIRATPADAIIRIDEKEIGPGPIEKQLVFNSPNETHLIAASRIGYHGQSVSVGVDSTSNDILLDLHPEVRRINIRVEPAPAIVKIDGHPISGEPVSAFSTDIEMGVDAHGDPITHSLTAERDNFIPAQSEISSSDRDPVYILRLGVMTKDLTITTEPPGAEIILDNDKMGVSPLTIPKVQFPVDLETNNYVPRDLRANKNGYVSAQMNIGWDDGKSAYSLHLPTREKEIRLFIDPPNSSVTIDGVPQPGDGAGIIVRSLLFPPIDAAGNLKTYSVQITKKADDAEWEPRTFTLAWEDGRTDYRVALKEVLTTPIRQLTLQPRKGDKGWTIAADWKDALAWRDIGETVARPQAKPVTQLAKGMQLGSLAIAPDGSQLVYTVISAASGNNDLRSLMFLIRSDASGAAQELTDGQSLDLFPSFSPSGDTIFFSSNRADARMQIWSVSAKPNPTLVRRTQDSTTDLWPTVDSDPRQRLFWQAMNDQFPAPRLQFQRIAGGPVTDLELTAAFQPRINSKNDSILFSAPDPTTGKRDIFRVSDKGGTPQNLTNTPDVDEYDAAWSRDGSRIIFAADRATDEQNQRNTDIWMIDFARPERVVRITSNPSLDDCPVFDVNGTSAYFRSSRGGLWGIWKVAIR